MNSNEKIALNLLVKRVLFWNKNCSDILKSPELKCLMLKFDSVENQRYEKVKVFFFSFLNLIIQYYYC